MTTELAPLESVQEKIKTRIRDEFGTLISDHYMQVTPATAMRRQRRALKTENKSFVPMLREIPRAAWPANYHPQGIKEVWRSRDFLVQIYDDRYAERMTVCRTAVASGDCLPKSIGMICSG